MQLLTHISKLLSRNRFIVSKRRLFYLWNILRHEKDELISKVYNTQKVFETKSDWCRMLKNEREKYSIEETDEEISKMSKYKFKSLVNKKVNNFAFKYLKDKAEMHKKSKNILEGIRNNASLKRQLYLNENQLSKTDCQLLFKLRTMMLDVKSNFSNQFNQDFT